MVAITAILAAVIAAFVLGIGPGDAPVEGAISVSGVDTAEGEIQLEVSNSGKMVEANIAGCADGTVFEEGDDVNAGDVLDETDIGDLDLSDCDSGDRINVVAQGPDGGEEIVGRITI